MALAPFLQATGRIAIGTAAAVLPRGGAAPTNGTIAGFSVPIQEEDYWCWAAVSCGVADLFSPPYWSQCGIATSAFATNRWVCCGADRTDVTKCNQPWYLDRALTCVGHFDRMDPSAISFAAIQIEVRAGRPLGCRIAWPGGDSAHFVAIGGWSVAPDGICYVDVHDPAKGKVQTSYEKFCHSYTLDRGQWTDSYFTKTPGAPASANSGGAAPVNNA